jgi:hypothetical protein
LLKEPTAATTDYINLEVICNQGRIKYLIYLIEDTYLTMKHEKGEISGEVKITGIIYDEEFSAF